jgi:phosphoglucosamine mutase
MKKLFGTDGIRGEAGAFPLDEKTVETIGNSLARQFTEKLGRSPRFITGRDTRESGAWIERAFCAGACAAEADCESAEIITTPGVAFLTKKFHFDAGVVVSASHNPYQDNGIKIFLPTGKKIDEAVEREIEKDIYEVNIENQTVGELGDLDVRAEDYQESYINYLADEFKTLDLTDLKIVVDCANGAACKLAPELFQKFGAEIVAINDAPDGVNINDNCGSCIWRICKKRFSKKRRISAWRLTATPTARCSLTSREISWTATRFCGLWRIILRRTES